jgi:hypothetical protein
MIFWSCHYGQVTVGFSPSYTAKISRLAKIKSRLIAWDWFGTRYVSCLCIIVVDHAA